jgi:hypothetical protein
MPTSNWFLLRMTRRMTGVISRIKLHAVVDPYTVSLVPRTVKSYSIWTVRNRPQQRHKQALHFGSASPFTFLCIPLHGSSVYHSSNPPLSGPKVFRNNSTQFDNTKSRQQLNNCAIYSTTVSIFLSHQNQATIFQPTESGNIFRAIRIRIRQIHTSRQNLSTKSNLIFDVVIVYSFISLLVWDSPKATWGPTPLADCLEPTAL